MSDDLATWLNAETNHRGWSLRQVAVKAGVSHTTIYKIANNERTPRAETCLAIAGVFGVDIEEVFRKAGLFKMPSERTTIQRAEYSATPSRTETKARSRAVADLVALYEELSEEDQALVMELVTRLAYRINPRVIGEGTKE